MTPVSAHAVANAFLDLAWKEGRQLTNMQLQKLVYIAQGFSLALLNSPIYFDDTQAWRHGPVIPSLYEELGHYGSQPVTLPLQSYDSIGDIDHQNIIDLVYSKYGIFHGFTLSDFTHKQNTPWTSTWNRKKHGVIEIDHIAKYYIKHLQPILEEAKKTSQQAIDEYHAMTPEQLAELDRELGLV